MELEDISSSYNEGYEDAIYSCKEFFELVIKLNIKKFYLFDIIELLRNKLKEIQKE